jgi:hypothetical protein
MSQQMFFTVEGELSAFCLSKALEDGSASTGADDIAPGDLELLSAKLPLLPGSACTWSERRLVVKATGERAVGITVGPSGVQSSGVVVVGIEYVVTGRWAGGLQCDVRSDDGVMVVIECRPQWMS